ncbi:MAG: GNAT family protein [bacterium]
MIIKEYSLSGQKVILRTIEESDVKHIMDYWYDRDNDQFQFDGAELKYFPPREKLEAKYISEIRSKTKDMPQEKLVIDLNSEPVGTIYIKNVNGAQADVHLHIWKKQHRRLGVATTIIKEAFLYFTKNFGIQKYILEPVKDNKPINKFLESLNLKPDKTYLKTTEYGTYLANQYVVDIESTNVTNG